MSTILPDVVTEAPKSQYSLEELLLFSIMVAGKPAHQTREKLKKLMSVCLCCTGPFDKIRCMINMSDLGRRLRWARTGQYRRINRAFRAVIELDPGTCSLEQLETVPGIGPKTARFFLLYTRPGIEVAALDTHILKYLRKCGLDAPKTTPPPGPKYHSLERAFIQIAKGLGMTPAQLDEQVWCYYAKPRPR